MTNSPVVPSPLWRWYSALPLSRKLTAIGALTSAAAMQGDRERCVGGRMDGYLSKPIDKEALFAAVERTAEFVAGQSAPALSEA